jgi:hypothetical protein
LLIIPTYAKVSHIDIFNGQVAFIRLDSIKDNDINFIPVNKGNNKITELRTILQRESQNS